MSEKIFKIALRLLLLIGVVGAFHEESIFEDEDIYRQALPPTIHTGLTVPGTKWCGPGNTAENYNDLGIQYEEDKCCRTHDHCENIMEPLTTFHGLRNDDLFPILKCSCEQEFINCLQKVNSAVSNTLGRVYFGARSKCFSKGHPIVRCKRYQEGSFRKRCILYVVDKNRLKVWQFYDMPFYGLMKSNE